MRSVMTILIGISITARQSSVIIINQNSEEVNHAEIFQHISAIFNVPAHNDPRGNAIRKPRGN
jgi:ribonucleotide reductase beta subunit family protein with ferritin-like domain